MSRVFVRPEDITNINSQLADIINFNFRKYGGKTFAEDPAFDNTPILNSVIAMMGSQDSLYFPKGDFRFATKPSVISKPIKIYGTGQQKTRLLIDGTWGTEFIQVGHSALELSKITMIADAPAGSTQVAIQDITGINIGDYIEVISNAPNTDAPERSTMMKGEIMRVRSIDTANRVLHLYSKLEDDYLMSNSAGIKKINMIDGVIFENFSVVNNLPNSSTIKFISLVNCCNILIKNIFLKCGDMAGLSLGNVYSGTIENAICEDFTNNEDGGRYGYGIEVTRATTQISISNCHFRRCRHGFTTNGVSNNFGSPSHILLENCTGTDGSNALFDTHQNGNFITFNNCTVKGSKPSADLLANTYGQSIGFQIRCKNVSINNCKTNYCDIGIQIDAYASGFDITGCAIKNNINKGIFIVGDTTINNGHVKEFIIKSNIITNSGEEAIYVGNTTVNGFITDNIIDGASKTALGLNAIHLIGCQKIRLFNNKIFDDLTGIITIQNGIYIDSTSGGCSALDNLIAHFLTKAIDCQSASSTVQGWYNFVDKSTTMYGTIYSTTGELEILTMQKGIILKSGDGSRWRVTATNAGVLSLTKL